MWTSTKVDFDYGANMTDWWEHDVECMVNKDYNHPCVIMYSIGNEIPETGNKFDVQWGKRLADKIRSMDDSRYVTNSLNLMLSVMDKIGQIMAAHAMQQQAPGENAEINSAMNSLGNMKDIVVSSEIAGKATEEAFGQVDIAGLQLRNLPLRPGRQDLSGPHHCGKRDLCHRAGCELGAGGKISLSDRRLYLDRMGLPGRGRHRKGRVRRGAAAGILRALSL